jgi:hypothetical protein
VRSGLIARTRAIVVGGEAYQRGFNIVKQTPPCPLASSAAGDEHIVATGAAMKGEKQSGGLAKASFGAISLYRAADLLGGGESDPDQRVAVVARAHLHEHRAARQIGRLGGLQEVRTLLEALDLHRLDRSFGHEKSRPFRRRRRAWFEERAAFIMV